MRINALFFIGTCNWNGCWNMRKYDNIWTKDLIYSRCLQRMKENSYCWWDNKCEQQTIISSYIILRIHIFITTLSPLYIAMNFICWGQFKKIIWAFTSSPLLSPKWCPYLSKFEMKCSPVEMLTTRRNLKRDKASETDTDSCKKSQDKTVGGVISCFLYHLHIK